MPVVTRRELLEAGVLVYLRDGSAGVPANLSGAHSIGSDDARETQWREIGLGAQILSDLNIKRIRLLTNHPRRVAGLEGFDIEIVEQVPVKLAAPQGHR